MSNGYAAWLNNDCGSSFAEFMGFEPPKLEHTYDGSKRCRYVKNGVQGEWCPNKTTAYKSYQVAKKAKRAAITKIRVELREQAKSLTADELNLLQRITGADKKRWQHEYCFTNFHKTASSGPEYDFAMTLVAKNLMGVRNSEETHCYFEVTPKGCRMVGVPERVIDDCRFARWYE
jgi:hypothetical protein